MSEFSTPYLTAGAFPTLFPYGTGDPFALTEDSSFEKPLTKIRHLLKYTEQDRNGGFVSRFAQHPRFVLWIYNVYYRHRTLSLGDVYIKQNPNDANLTVDELIDLTRNGSNTEIIKRLQLYMANIPGTPSYWHNVNNQLKAIMESKGLPHFFYTLSFADR